MKILIIGFGSIGKRHYEILDNLKEVRIIDIVSKQKIPENNSFSSLEEVSDLTNYDYFIVSNETAKHHIELKYLCSQVKNKKILVEKPLYDKLYPSFSCNNEIFIAYNLRFHPLIEKLSLLLKSEKVSFASVYCGQYLPTWRPMQDYKSSYSASISKGGGVLRDLSHELDYMTWIFGDIERIHAISSKISTLEIDSDDIFTAIAVSKQKVLLNITMDYISKTPMRKILIHTQDKTIDVNFIKNKLTLYHQNSKKETIQIKNIDRNYTYHKMHQAIINDNVETLSTYNEGEKIVKLIDTIKFEELL